MILEVSNLSIELDSRAQKKQILKSVSLSVGEGEFVALVGGSGSGKTMTARSIMHLLPENASVSGGMIQFCGTDIAKMERSEFSALSGKDIAMIFQEPMTSLNPLIKVGRQIEEVATVHGVPKKEARRRARELAVLTGLSDTERILASYPHQLSGGMKQRILIASALMNSPKLLIADEPTTALDVSTQEEIIAILAELHRKCNISLLLITHDFSIVRKLCSRVYVLHGGTIIETAATAEMFSHPKQTYTKALIDSIPDASRRSQRLPVYDEFFEN